MTRKSFLNKYLIDVFVALDGLYYGTYSEDPCSFAHGAKVRLMLDVRNKKNHPEGWFKNSFLTCISLLAFRNRKVKSGYCVTIGGSGSYIFNFYNTIHYCGFSCRISIFIHNCAGGFVDIGVPLRDICH